MTLSSGAPWLLLLLAVISLCWVVGAYNRLMTLRNGIVTAWSQMALALQQRSAVVLPLVAALREPLAAEQGALDAFLGAHGQAVQAAVVLAGKPVAVAAAADWVRAESLLSAATSRLLALVEQQPALPAAPEVGPLLATWALAQSQLAFARRLFDAAAGAYNEAARTLPTRWLLRLFGFGPAGLLDA
jgi:LemA protein